MPKSDRPSSAIKPIIDYLEKVNSSADYQQIHLNGTGAVAALEDKIKDYYGMKYALCVSSATAGLMAIALALDLRDVDFVTSPLSYGASVASWLVLGNTVVFADIETPTLTISAESAQRSITPKTRAILTVDVFGNPTDAEAIRKVCDEHGLWFVADAAQSLGAYRAGAPASSMADVLVISFGPTKTLFAGEGGAIVTNNAHLFEKVVWWTQHISRQAKDLGLGLLNEFSLNARINPLSAIWAHAVFDESLANLKLHQERCFEIIRAMNSIGLTTPIDFETRQIQPSFFRLTAKWKEEARCTSLITALHKHGLATSIEGQPFSLLYSQPALIAHYERQCLLPIHCPNAEEEVKNRFTLTYL